MHWEVQISRRKNEPTQRRHLVNFSEKREVSQVTLHYSLSHVFSFDPLLFVFLFLFFSFFYLFFFFFFFFFFFRITNPCHPPWWLHLGRQWGLYGLCCISSYSFILFGYSNASPLMHFFFFLLPTPTRLWCFCPCHHHHLPLSYGSFTLVGPSPMALRALSHLFSFGSFSLFFVCTTMIHLLSSMSCRHRPCGGLAPLDLALVVPWAMCHSLWWFPHWLRCFLRETTKVFQPCCAIAVCAGLP